MRELTFDDLKTTYWGKRILEAEKRGFFTANDNFKAGDWTTCACGKQDPRIPREYGCPLDDQLCPLGIEFAGAVNFNDFLLAKETLVAIENRARILLGGIV